MGVLGAMGVMGVMGVWLQAPKWGQMGTKGRDSRWRLMINY